MEELDLDEHDFLIGIVNHIVIYASGSVVRNPSNQLGSRQFAVDVNRQHPVGDWDHDIVVPVSMLPSFGSRREGRAADADIGVFDLDIGA